MNDHGYRGIRLSRSSVPAIADIRVPGHQWSCEVIDLSLSGVLIRRPADFSLEAGDLASVELSSGDFVALRTQARTMRSGQETLALAFEGLGPSQIDDIRELIRRQGELKDGLG